MMMMSTCDCVLPQSPALRLIPATGGDTQRGQGEAAFLHHDATCWMLQLVWISCLREGGSSGRATRAPPGVKHVKCNNTISYSEQVLRGKAGKNMKGQMRVLT